MCLLRSRCIALCLLPSALRVLNKEGARAGAGAGALAEATSIAVSP